MKFVLATLLTAALLITKKTDAQIYKTEDTLYVWAKSGLLLRNGDTANAKVISSIPFGTRIILKEAIYHDSLDITIREKKGPARTNINTIDWNIKGSYVKIHCSKGTGYVFSGYLGHLKPFQNDRSTYLDLLKQNFKLIKTDTTIIEYGHIIDHFFEDGLVMQEISSGGGRVVIKKFFFPKERFEELYLIINYKLDYLLLVDSAPRNLLLSPNIYFSTRSEGYVEMEKSGAWTIVTHFCDDETGPCNY